MGFNILAVAVVDFIMISGITFSLVGERQALIPLIPLCCHGLSCSLSLSAQVFLSKTTLVLVLQYVTLLRVFAKWLK